MLEVTVCREQGVAVSNAQLNEQGVNGAELHAGAPARVAQVCRAYVVGAIRLYERDMSEAVDDLLTRTSGYETLQQLLQDQTGGHDDVFAAERTAKFRDFGGVVWSVATKRERPHARVDKQGHDRERSDL